MSTTPWPTISRARASNHCAHRDAGARCHLGHRQRHRTLVLEQIEEGDDDRPPGVVAVRGAQVARLDRGRRLHVTIHDRMS
jgi:hypothetical protein